jgi:hypothetical protein
MTPLPSDIDRRTAEPARPGFQLVAEVLDLEVATPAGDQRHVIGGGRAGTTGHDGRNELIEAVEPAGHSLGDGGSGPISPGPRERLGLGARAYHAGQVGFDLEQRGDHDVDRVVRKRADPEPEWRGTEHRTGQLRTVPDGDQRRSGVLRIGDVDEPAEHGDGDRVHDRIRLVERAGRGPEVPRIVMNTDLHDPRVPATGPLGPPISRTRTSMN